MSALSPITRIDLEEIGDHLIRVEQWREGWSEGATPDVSETVQGAIMFLLMGYEKQGYTCEMCDAHHGRALRGKTTRVDFERILGQWHIRKYPVGWTAKTKPLTDVIKTEAESEAAIQWCESQGWTVHRINADKVRAWKGAARPVNTAGVIRKLRQRANDERRDFRVDLAYDG